MNNARDDHDGHDPSGPEPESGVDPESDPETDHFVRRLLADARTDAPVPDHVVARLDQTLAGLRAERAEHSAHPAPAGPPATATGVVRDGRARASEVTDLADVRRRRRRLLVGLGAAAAFVVAAGVALPTLVGSDSSDRGSVATGDQTVTELGQQGPVALRAASAEEAVQAYVAGLDEPVETPAAAPLRSPMGGDTADSEGSADAEDSGESAFGAKERLAADGAPPLTCEEPGEGELHPATYDGRAALLVLTGLEDDAVLARVVVCDGDSAVNSASQVVVQFVVPQP